MYGVKDPSHTPRERDEVMFVLLFVGDSKA